MVSYFCTIFTEYQISCVNPSSPPICLSVVVVFSWWDNFYELLDYSCCWLIGLADKAVVSSLTKDCVSKLNDDCLVQCWFRFLHVLSNPVDLCRVEVISETPKFLHHALASEKVGFSLILI